MDINSIITIAVSSTVLISCIAFDVYLLKNYINNKFVRALGMVTIAILAAAIVIIIGIEIKFSNDLGTLDEIQEPAVVSREVLVP